MSAIRSFVWLGLRGGIRVRGKLLSALIPTSHILAFLHQPKQRTVGRTKGKAYVADHRDITCVREAAEKGIRCRR
jgi:hypothetical protein